MSECGSKGCDCVATPISLSEPSTNDARPTRTLYRIDNMDCPTEEALIRDKLSKLSGVAGLEFNLMQRTLTVSHEMQSLRPVEQALSAIGMRAVRMDEAPTNQSTVLVIAKMDCPTEGAMIRGKLAGMADVATLDFNLVKRTLTVNHAPDALPRVLAALKALGFDAEEHETETQAKVSAPEPSRISWLPLPVSGVAATLAEVVYWPNGGNH